MKTTFKQSWQALLVTMIVCLTSFSASAIILPPGDAAILSGLVPPAVANSSHWSISFGPNSELIATLDQGPVRYYFTILDDRSTAWLRIEEPTGVQQELVRLFRWNGNVWDLIESIIRFPLFPGPLHDYCP